MNKIHTIAHIRTPRMLKSFRACVNMTGKSQILAEFGRIISDEYQRLNRVQQASGKRILRRSA
ncbi:MAG: hypothetical protein WCH01_15555, partial [Methylococcaceae bacterium]